MSGLKASLLLLFLSVIPGVTAQPSFRQKLRGICSQISDRFDISALNCQLCDPAENKVVSDDGQYCVCDSGYVSSRDTNANTDILEFTCSSCLSAGKASSRDRSRCMFCQNSTSYLDTTSGDCKCRNDNYVLKEKDKAGNFLENKTCLPCAHKRRVLTSDPYTCAACAHAQAAKGSDGSCTCNSGYTQAGDDWCVLSTDASTILTTYPLATASKVTYSNVIPSFGETSTTATVSSSLFYSQSFLAAAQECMIVRNRTACNALANMCAIAGYTTHPTCTFLQNIVANAPALNLNATHGFSTWVDTLPLKYFIPNKKNREALTFTVEVETKLNFLLAIYDFNGTYKGFAKLKGQLQLCGRNPFELENWRKAGTSYENSCVLELDRLIEGVKGTEFYSLFISNPDLTTIYPVAVEVEELQTNSRVGRFFLLDVNSSISSAGGSPAYIQYAASISLDIPVQDGKSDLLYPPRLRVKYAQRPYGRILSRGNGALARVTFVVNYTGSYEGIWIAGTVLFALGIVLVVSIWGIQTYVSCRLYSQGLARLSAGGFFRIVVSLLELTSFMLLAVSGILSTIALILFKGQSTFHLLLPPDGSAEVTAFEVTIIFAFFGSFLGIVLRVWDQLHLDVFFIDWEKPKSRQAPDDFPEDGGHGKGKATVSVWRRILVINKYNELLSTRLFSVPFALFLIIFFLLGLRLGNLALTMPVSNLSREGVPYHPFLRFALIFLSWIVCAGGQLFFRTSCFRRYVEDASASFVDLLHSANISCLILDKSNHGYYLHGQSVHTHADTDLETLSRQIFHETRALVRERGLLPGKDTFEIFLDPHFCTFYEREYKQHYRRNLLRTQGIRRDMRRAADASRAMQRKNAPSVDMKQSTGIHQNRLHEKSLATSNDSDEKLTGRLMQMSGKFERFLKDFILNDHPEFSWQERPPSFCFYALGIPPHANLSQSLNTDFCCEMCTDSGCDGCFRSDTLDDREVDGEAADAKMNRAPVARNLALQDQTPTSIFYNDPSRHFKSVFLMGIEKQIIAFLLLLHATMDIAFENTIASVLVVAAANLVLEECRLYFGKDNLSKKTMLHEKFFL